MTRSPQIQTPIHVLNLGAGVQSTTLYLMAMKGMFRCDYAIFADTGDEPAAVYRHLAWLQSLGGPKILVRSKGRLSDHLRNGSNSTGGRFASIPAFTINPVTEEEGKTRRQCSKEYKVEVIERTIRRELCKLEPRQRIPKSIAITQYIGFSIDEAVRGQRMTSPRWVKPRMVKSEWKPGFWKKPKLLGDVKFPLIERFMTRDSCLEWLAEFGNVPHEVPRSACVYCPFHDDAEWLRIKSVPEDWALAVEVDESLRKKGNVVNRNMDAEMFLHRSCKPLVQIEFKPQAENKQTDLAFYRDCLGVCGS